MTEDTMTRKQKWKAFYEQVERQRHPDAAPAFIQEITAGLWSVQKLVRPTLPNYGAMYQMFNDPPPASDFEARYNGWPGDHRGWMRFESKESARDFYKFAEGIMSFDEYRALPHPPLGRVHIDLDEKGEFAPTRS